MLQVRTLFHSKFRRVLSCFHFASQDPRPQSISTVHNSQFTDSQLTAHTPDTTAVNTMNNSFLSDATVAFIKDKIKQQQQQDQQHGAADSSAVTGTSSLTEPSTITASMTSSSSASSSLRKNSKQNHSFQSGPLSLHLENQALETENTKLFDIVLECVRALEEKSLHATEISHDSEKKIQGTTHIRTKHSSMTVVKKPTQNNIEHLVHQISLQTKKRDKMQMNPNTDKKQQQECIGTAHGLHSTEEQLCKTQHELRDALDLIKGKENKIVQMQFEMDRLSSDLNWSESRRKELNLLLEMSQVDIGDRHDKNGQSYEINSDESDEDDDDGDVSFSTPLASALRKMPNSTPSTKDNNMNDTSGRNTGQCTSSHLRNNRNKWSTMDVPQKRTTTAPSAPQTRNNNNIFPQQRYQPTQQGTLYHVPQTSMYPNPFAAPQNPSLNNNRNMLGLVVTAGKNDEQDTVISDLHSHAGASKYQEGNGNTAVQACSSFEKQIAEFYNDT